MSRKFKKLKLFGDKEMNRLNDAHERIVTAIRQSKDHDSVEHLNE